MCRLMSASLALLLPLLACSIAPAQVHSGKPSTCEIQVHVTYNNDRPVGMNIRVELLNQQSVLMDQQFTDSEGRVVFHVSNTDAGGYRVHATGTEIDEGFSDSITINPGDRMAVAYVRVEQKQPAGPSATIKTSKSASTSANELRVPADAKRAFMKGMDALYRHDYPKAAEAFEKAVAAYPQYDMAYDNLGVTYVMLAQPAKARAAFERGVQLNDKNASADRNYARLLLGSNENARALELLNKSLSVEPQNPSTLTLISIAQLRTGDVDNALRNALKVHQLSHEPHEAAHYIAGRAYEEKQEYQQARVEYETYLQESPDGPEAVQVHRALARLTASASPAPQTGAPQP
jgi:Tfp pilus assembly protein PilF